MKLKFFAMLPLGLFLLGATSTETNASDLMVEDEEHVDNYDSTEDSFEEISHRNTGKMTKEEKNRLKELKKSEKNRLKEIKKNEKKRKKSLEDANSSYENESDEATEAENGDKKPGLWARFKNKIHRNQNTDESKTDKKSQNKSSKDAKKSKYKSNKDAKDDAKKPGLMTRIKSKFSRSKDSNKK
ncbi:MAG: hypothetical protein K6C34_00500 [Alphaproteobacteria bacterium]|nr:hypothetical protein [Alphaproteobacteria bacterium]